MRLPLALSASALYHACRLWCATLRYRECDREAFDRLDAAGERLVICLWHDEMFPLPRAQRQLRLVALVSASRDGEMLARVLSRLGLRTVRGSSGRGGVQALLGAARLMKSETAEREPLHACLTVDGPRGPRHRAKDGALFLAHHADAYIAPLRLRITPVLRIRSWDRFQIPLPFCRVEAHFGSPWKMPPGEWDSAALEAGRRRLEQDMADLGRGWPEPGQADERHGR